MTDSQIEGFESVVFGVRQFWFQDQPIPRQQRGDTVYTILKFLHLSGFFQGMSRKAYVLSLSINGTPVYTSAGPRTTRSPSVQLATVPASAFPDTRRITIEADVVMLLLPDTTSIPEQIDLDDNGEPILPDDTLLYRRLTLTETVDNPAR